MAGECRDLCILRNNMIRFIPKPGQTDYTHARWAPVITCVVMHGNNILLVKRSRRMRLYPGFWNAIGGFLDDNKSLKEKVEEELKEELGIKKHDILSMRFGEIFDADDRKYRKTFVIHPVIVRVRSKNITLDWEAEEYVWVTPREASKFRVVPSFRISLKKLFPRKNR